MLLLALAACSNNPAPLIAPAPEEDISVETEDDYIQDLEYEYDYIGDMDPDPDFNLDSWPEMPVFGSWTGTVVEINVEYVYPPTYFFSLEGDSGNATFIANFNTFTLGNTPEVGDTITGFYLMDMPMAMIYPPQYNVSVIVNGEFTSIEVDRFDDELVSYSGNLRLNIGDDTEIMLQDGEPFDCELAHRKLVVVYDIATRSIPALTTPRQIIVLFEHAVTGPAFL